MDGHEERLRRIEETLDRLRGEPTSESWPEPKPPAEASQVEPVESADEPEGAADLALSLRDGKPGTDRFFVCLAEIANLGEGVARNVRWWLSTEEGDVVSTVAGGEDMRPPASGSSWKSLRFRAGRSFR